MAYGFAYTRMKRCVCGPWLPRALSQSAAVAGTQRVHSSSGTGRRCFSVVNDGHDVLG